MIVSEYNELESLKEAHPTAISIMISHIPFAYLLSAPYILLTKLPQEIITQFRLSPEVILPFTMSATNTITSLQEPESAGRLPYTTVKSQVKLLRLPSPMQGSDRPGGDWHKSSSIRTEESFTQLRGIEKHSNCPTSCVCIAAYHPER